jgi:hypothetical protein
VGGGEQSAGDFIRQSSCDIKYQKGTQAKTRKRKRQVLEIHSGAVARF